MIILKSPYEIKMIERACRIAAGALEMLANVIKPGVKTKELEEYAEAYIKAKGGIPAFKGYRGYPASICVSVNNQVVHGIPSQRVLKDGDIVSIDLGVIYEGYYGDAARSYGVGNIGELQKKLLEVTERALYIGIDKAKAGNRVGDISSAIQNYVESNGFSVVKAFVGHGIGKYLHEEPQVPNFGKPGKGPRLKEGMTIAIEPMVNTGSPDVMILEDGWTAVTVDGGYSAHFEHTVVITRNGAQILTKLN
ncbi:MAG: type I methionyl aminopeptidase [Thermodesulfovibrionales bacterium]|nr:type I methionyl aminopeptidase [Thermodesulfovibrionales bacterium]